MQIDLSTSDGYKLASGLRGPDEPNGCPDDVKRVTTAVLRYFAGVTHDGAFIFSPEWAKQQFEANPYNFEGWATWYNKQFHFNYHFCSGMKSALNIHKKNGNMEAVGSINEYMNFLKTKGFDIMGYMW